MSNRISSSGRDNPDSVTWPELLALASTPQEVVQIALDFLASLTPREVAGLPPECVPPHRFAEPEQIVDHAFTLVRARCRVDEDNTVLFRTANFFSHAARRVAQLTSEMEPPDAANNASMGTTPGKPRP